MNVRGLLAPTPEAAAALAAPELLGELLGTFLLVFLGLGAVHSAVEGAALAGLGQVAAVWGAAVLLGILVARPYSEAHLNPAITAALAVHRRFPARKVPGYVAAQVLGALAAAALLHVLYAGPIASFEHVHHLLRGAAGSEASAMMYAEFYPNPSTAAALGWAATAVPWTTAALAEAFGTAVLAFLVFSLTDRRTASPALQRAAPALIGLTVAMLIAVLAPLTQAGFNPAREFGPRVVAYLAGWGRIALAGPDAHWPLVYLAAPIAGAVLGGGLQILMARARTAGIALPVAGTYRAERAA